MWDNLASGSMSNITHRPPLPDHLQSPYTDLINSQVWSITITNGLCPQRLSCNIDGGPIIQEEPTVSQALLTTHWSIIYNASEILSCFQFHDACPFRRGTADWLSISITVSMLCFSECGRGHSVVLTVAIKVSCSPNTGSQSVTISYERCFLTLLISDGSMYF